MKNVNRWIVVAIILNLITIIGIVLVVWFDKPYVVAIVPAVPTLVLDFVVKSKFKNDKMNK